MKAKGREIHLQIKAFAEDPTRTVLSFPPMHPQLRSQVYLSSKKLDLFTHCELVADSEEKRISVYKEERVDDFSDEVQKFLKDDTRGELSFPTSLTTKERSKLHDLAKELGLYSVSIGEGKAKYICLEDRTNLTPLYVGSNRRLVLSKEKRLVTTGDVNSHCRKLFLTLTSLPIPILTSPLFEYFVELYQPLLRSQDRLKEFLQLIDACGGESQLMQHYNTFKDTLGTTLKQSDAYKKMSLEGLVAIKKQYEIPGKSLKRLNRARHVFSPANHDRKMKKKTKKTIVLSISPFPTY